MSRVSESFCRLMQHLHGLQGAAWFSLDLSMAQFKALMLIGSSGGLTGRDLAQRLGVGPSAVTPLVDRLVQRGYVLRNEDPIDRRVTWTRLTPAGLEVFERIVSTGQDQIEGLLTELTPAEVAQVEHALDLLNHAAERRTAPPDCHGRPAGRPARTGEHAAGPRRAPAR